MSEDKYYVIGEQELRTFHLVAVLATGQNVAAQEIVDEIRSRPVEWPKPQPKHEET